LRFHQVSDINLGPSPSEQTRCLLHKRLIVPHNLLISLALSRYDDNAPVCHCGSFTTADYRTSVFLLPPLDELGDKPRSRTKSGGEEISRVRTFDPGHVFRCSLGHDAPASLSTLRPEIDDPVGAFDDVEVVLDDQDGVALID
jgi:hypothetical protein